MRSETLAGFGAALAFHALALFGFHGGTAARPLPVEATRVEVDLVAAAPAPTVAEVEPPKPEPPPISEPPKPEMREPPPALPEQPPLESTHAPPEKPSATPAPAPRPIARSKPASAAATGPAAAAREGHVGTAPATTIARPRYRSNPAPVYPPDARRLRQQGQVLLTVEVSAEGRALSVALKRSSGFPLLDQAALATVRRWSFEPSRAGGMAVSSRAEVPLRFRLAE